MPRIFTTWELFNNFVSSWKILNWLIQKTSSKAFFLYNELIFSPCVTILTIDTNSNMYVQADRQFYDIAQISQKYVG